MTSVSPDPLIHQPLACAPRRAFTLLTAGHLHHLHRKEPDADPLARG